MTPIIRVTFFHATLSPSGTVVNSPLGWEDITISLTKDPTFHSLIEYFKGSFVWYGAARTFILNCLQLDGPDTIIRSTIEIRYNNSWQTLFDGLVDASQKENLSKSGIFYKIATPIIRDDFWATFMNRRGTKVDLQAAVDLDGEARTPVNKITLPLPTQKINLSYHSTMFDTSDITRTPIEFEFVYASDLRVLQFSLPIITKKGLDNYWGVSPVVLESSAPLTFGNKVPPNFTAKYKGTYQVDISIFISTSPYSVPYGGGDQVINVGMYIFKNGVYEDVAAIATLGVNGVSGRTHLTYSGSFNLEANESLTFYLYSGIGGDGTYFIVYNNGANVGDESYINIDAVTEYEDTTTDAYLIKDAFESVLSKIIGQDNVISSTLFTTCRRLNAIFKGIHGRGFTFTDKPFTVSFNDLWNGFEPVANIGLGYTEEMGVKKIVIEDKSFFYGKTPSVFIPNVSNLTNRNDLDKLYKTVEVGFNKRFIESDGGIDDPQTFSSWRTKFRTIGIDLKIMSTFFLASLGIEQNRRNGVNDKDGKIDEDIIMVALQEDGADYRPEVGTDFNSITDLENSNTRYNVRHTCARIFKRWQSFIQGCLQYVAGGTIYYSAGEGNRVMSSQLETTDCESTGDPEPILVEDADVPVTDDYLFIPEVFKCTVPMAKSTYDAILADKNNAIAISQSEDSYLPMHIIDYDFKVFRGKAELTLLQASKTPVTPTGEYIVMEDGALILTEDGGGILME